MHVIVFEDELVDRLFPITASRPAYSVHCGSYRLIDLIFRLENPVTGLVRPHLATLQELDFPEFTRLADVESETVLLLNARVVPSITSFSTIRELIKNERCGVVRHDQEIAAVVAPINILVERGATLDDSFGLPIHFRDLERLPLLAQELQLLQYPHDVVRFNLTCISENIAHRLEHDGLKEIRDGVFVAEGAQIGDYVITDTSSGPIVLDRDAKIGPYCYLSGPAYLGPKARVIEHSAIKDAVSIGHTAKIGGEVEASVIEPYTNKQHHGFLGHSYLGSWINLGAGTCNSDLKNTYGEVKMEYRGGRVATKMQFVGCIMGDYSKSAINTGIFTGKTIGVCSMLYGFVTTNVPSFVNYARSFGQVTEMSPQVMVSTQARMFERRNVSQRPADIQLLHDMYALTSFERQIAGEPLAL